jgi:integrase
MSTIHLRIDKKAIEKAIKDQRSMNGRLFLADTDCKGLRLAINSRTASWTYAYRKRGFDFGGKRFPMRTLKLGDVVTMTPTEARFEAEQVKALVRDGGDPAVERRKAQRDQLNASDADRPLTWWLDVYVRSELGDDTRHKQYEASHIRLGLAEMEMSDQPPASIAEDNIKDLLQLHRDRPATARHRFGAMSRFLDFLQDQKVIQSNPAQSVSKKRRPKPPAPRSTFYDADVLNRLWNPEKSLKDVYLRYLRFLITTPLRAKEAAELIAGQVSTSRMEISLSAADTKNSEAFVMPLSELAKQQLLIGTQTDDQRVFQLSSKAEKPMNSWSHFNASVRKATGVKNFNLHDLRRTFSTLTAEHSEFGEGLIDGLLNHKQSATRSGVIRHYQMAKYVERRREVMDWWGEFLKKVLVYE